MAEERLKNTIGPEPPKSEDGGKRSYERSTIEFPYTDLNDAAEVVKAIAANAGTSCTLDQLAAYLGQTMTSGAFRGRVSNAGTFRLTANKGGEVQLTELGRQIVDPAQEARARADSFMEVPLYKAVFEKYRGYALPPASALEREMMELGVAPKQADKARQAFMRSAKQAGYFAHGEDRLVRPAVGQAPPGTKPLEPEKPKESETPTKQNGGGGGFEGLHPFIQGLLQTLPHPQTEWHAADRAKWLQTAANIFDLIYKGEGGVEVRAAPAHRSPRPD